jgi:hypothetical protein
LNIHNHCSNVDLVSPIYNIDIDLECHRPPDYKVCAGDTMSSGFIIKSDGVSYGALIYRLQRKWSHRSIKIGKCTSSIAQLLVVWRISKFKELYADVLLVEHSERFNKDNLKVLYHKNINQFRLCPDSATVTWSLDDNTTIMTTFKIMNGGHVLDIIISELERDSCAKKPAHIKLGK